jgi:hypothetical protein
MCGYQRFGGTFCLHLQGGQDLVGFVKFGINTMALDATLSSTLQHCDGRIYEMGTTLVTVSLGS